MGRRCPRHVPSLVQHANGYPLPHSDHSQPGIETDFLLVIYHLPPPIGFQHADLVPIICTRQSSPIMPYPHIGLFA